MILEWRKSADSGELTSAQKAVYAVAEKAGTEYLPAALSTDVTDSSGNKYTLTATQYVEYQTNYLRIYWETAEEALSGAKTDAEKVAALKAAKKTAKDTAEDTALKQSGHGTNGWAQKYGSASADEVTSVLAAKDLVDDDGFKQAEATEILEESYMDKQDKALIWQTITGAQSTKNNPWGAYLPDGYEP